MGANQTRPGEPKRSKKSKGGATDATSSNNAGPSSKVTPSKDQQHHEQKTIRSPSPQPYQQQPTRASPPTAQPLAAAAAAQADPTFDENSHPFHAPLDHVREEERPLNELSQATHFDVTTLRKLQIIFTDIAESEVDDGIIDGNELTDAMGLEPSCLLARTIFRIFDISRQKKIDFAQWVRTISALSSKASLEEKIRFSFSLYDLNGDGEIDVEELRAMLEAAVLDENVLHLTTEEVKEWCDHTLSQVDTDSNGKIDYQEYRSMVQNSVKFLESFTLDIHELCNSFRFKKQRAGEKMTAHEVDQRLLWFRARQRQYSGSRSSAQSSSQHGESQDGSHRNAASGASARNPSGSGAEARNARASPNMKTGGSSIHKPIDVATPLPSTQPTSANSTPHGHLPLPFSGSRGGGGVGGATNHAYDDSSPDASPNGSRYAPPRIHSSQASSASENESTDATAASTTTTTTTLTVKLESADHHTTLATSSTTSTIVQQPQSPASPPPSLQSSDASSPVFHADAASPSASPQTVAGAGVQPMSGASAEASEQVTKPQVRHLTSKTSSGTLSEMERERKNLTLEQERMLRQSSTEQLAASQHHSIHHLAAHTSMEMLRQSSVGTIQQSDDEDEPVHKI